MNVWNADDILKLTLTKGASYKKQISIITNFKDFESFSNSEHFQEELGFEANDRAFKSNLDALVYNQKEICRQYNANFLTIFDEKYPTLLKHISQPPLWLFYAGELQEANSDTIAIVGTRNCSTYGRITAENYASYFARNSIVIVSGLAVGIDTYAHKSTINAGGKTYAILGCGIDKLNSSEQLKNAHKIVDSGGAVISQFLCGTSSFPPLFLQRNRIISGISKATVVIESGYKGGSLNTARFAAEESRDVFAIPGNISAEKSRGTNELLKKGSALITLSPDDVLETLGWKQKTLNIIVSPEFKTIEEQKIWEILSMEPIHIDELSDKSNIEISKLLVLLLEMEFSGLIRQLPGKNFIKEII